MNQLHAAVVFFIFFYPLLQELILHINATFVLPWGCKNANKNKNNNNTSILLYSKSLYKENVRYTRRG